MKKVIAIILCIFALGCGPSYPNYDQIYYHYERGAWHPYHTYREHHRFFPSFNPNKHG